MELDDRTDPDNVALDVSLTQFSPVLKLLCADSATLSCSSIFDLVHPFPFSKTWPWFVGIYRRTMTTIPVGKVVIPSVSGPVFTGSLELSLGELGHTARRPPNLPSGLHFRKLAFM